MKGIDDAKAFSELRLNEVRAAISQVVPSDQLIVTCGSYARREASELSDMDYYAILEGASSAPDQIPWSAALRTEIERIVGKLPASGGAFAINIVKKELFENYGGSRDSNESITRRMLYLLEGDYLTNSSDFYETRRRIIERYINETPSDHQIAFYLLNDVVRYWRTMAVDYAHKTSGAANPKPWAIRNIKLVFSRKLIYASGLFSIALTADRSRDQKIAILEKLFSLTPIDRIKFVCGDAASQRLLEMYSMFLEEIGDPGVRAHLDTLPRDSRTDDTVFRRLKNEGHYFSRELMGLFQKTFHATHPIHMAVIF